MPSTPGTLAPSDFGTAMNIFQIKALSWVVSAALAASLLLYVFDFYSHRGELQTRKISAAEAREILESAQIPEGPRLSFNDARAVERAFLELNWSGERPPAPAPEVAPIEGPAAPIHRPMSEILSIQMLMEDTLNPDRGRAFIAYLPAANVTLVNSDLSIEIRVGEKLTKPHDYATVMAITTAEGVTFSFADEARPNESLAPKEFDASISIHVVGQGQNAIEAIRVNVPRLQRDLWRPQHTTMTSDNTFVIGTEDAQNFADDYGGILAREVRHSRHRDPRTGKYDGIELKEVKSGGRVAAHGGQSGDIIKSINGHPVTSTAEAITYVKNNQDNYSTWEIVVENKGQLRTIIYESPQND